ncbi:hypothetical protein G9A89_010833 [Geosiphon pyriformis]|nr:hypothetical protein G9A89_010833 [Geosiphon pyriformis]
MYTDLLVGHFKKTKTIQKTLAHYYWPTLEKDIAEYIKTVTSAKEEPNHKENIHPISVGQLFDRIGIDVVGSLTITPDGNRYVITATDYLIKTVNYDITSYEPFYLLYEYMATLPIETDIKTISFEEITIGNYKDILQRKLGTILDSLVETRIIAFEKIKQFQEKLKKKKTYKTLSLSVSNLVLEYHSDRDNVYGDKFSSWWKGPFIVNKVLNNGSYILQDQSRTIFNNCPVHST